MGRYTPPAGAAELATSDPSRVWASARVTTDGTPAAVVLREYNVASVTYSAPGGEHRYDVVFSEAMPDANYALQVTPINFSGNLATITANISQVTPNGFRVQFMEQLPEGDPSYPAFTLVQGEFSFEAKLGEDPA